MRGFINKDYNFVGWSKLASKQRNKIKKIGKSVIGSNEFKLNIEKLVGHKFFKVDNIEILRSNKYAMSKRLELINNANKEINLLTWGFYDDETGQAFADALINVKKRGVEVRVVVDARTSSRSGFDKELKKLEESEVKVIYWKGVENSYYGMHSKLLVVDDFYSIEGGRNIGKHYLKNEQWEDLDVFYQGQVSARKNLNLFSGLWNNQVSSQKLNFKNIKTIKTLNPGSKGIADYGSILSRPSEKELNIISDLQIYAINNAQKEIKIVNAYVILTKEIQEALEGAIKRGVKVKVLSNSLSSVDEPIVIVPIQKSLMHLFKLGAEVYLKEGKTLHTKALVADSFSLVTSYNLHPRSALYEVEKAFYSLNPRFNKNLKAQFNKSFREASRVESKADFNFTPNPSLDYLHELIFNQL